MSILILFVNGSERSEGKCINPSIQGEVDIELNGIELKWIGAERDCLFLLIPKTHPFQQALLTGNDFTSLHLQHFDTIFARGSTKTRLSLSLTLSHALSFSSSSQNLIVKNTNDTTVGKLLRNCNRNEKGLQGKKSY